AVTFARFVRPIIVRRGEKLHTDPCMCSGAPGLRAFHRFVLSSVVILCVATIVRAGFNESQEWFNALPLEDRTEIQSDLILLGYYNFLVDGAFGQGTFAGLSAFQRSHSRAVTGVLSDGDLTRLKADADDVAS